MPNKRTLQNAPPKGPIKRSAKMSEQKVLDNESFKQIVS